MAKVVIPTLDEDGEQLSAHFGRAPHFAWYEIQEGTVIEKGVIPNDSDHFGSEGLPPERIARLKPDAVLTPGMGMKAITMFQDMGIAVMQALEEGVEKNIDLFIDGKLKELTEGCLHAHDH